MKDRQPYAPSPICFEIPTDWSQNQARAVAEFFLDVAMNIMSYYSLYDDDKDECGDTGQLVTPDLPLEPGDDELPF